MLFDFLSDVEMPIRVSAVDLCRARTELPRLIAEAKLVHEREEAEAERRRAEDDRLGRMFKSNPEDVVAPSSTPFESFRQDVFGFLRKHETRFTHEMMRLVNERCGGEAAVCYRRAGLSRQLYSRTVSGRHGGPSRETAMRLALGLKLGYDEAVEFLSCAGFVIRLWHPIDAVFAYCYKNAIYNMLDVNELIVQLGEKPLEIV